MAYEVMFATISGRFQGREFICVGSNGLKDQRVGAGWGYFICGLGRVGILLPRASRRVSRLAYLRGDTASGCPTAAAAAPPVRGPPLTSTDRGTPIAPRLFIFSTSPLPLP
jgi:hypothetical protein